MGKGNTLAAPEGKDRGATPFVDRSSLRLAPIPVLGRQRDEDLPLGVARDVVEIKRALAFFGAPLPEREQPRQPAIGRAVAREAQEARRILQVEARADDKAQAHLLGCHMRAHDAGERVAVGDGDRVEA